MSLDIVSLLLLAQSSQRVHKQNMAEQGSLMQIAAQGDQKQLHEFIGSESENTAIGSGRDKFLADLAGGLMR